MKTVIKSKSEIDINNEFWGSKTYMRISLNYTHGKKCGVLSVKLGRSYAKYSFQDNHKFHENYEIFCLDRNKIFLESTLIRRFKFPKCLRCVN